VQPALLFGAGLPLLDSVLLAVLLVALPVLALAQLPLVASTPMDRLPAYWGSIATLWLLGTACWLVGTRAGGPAAVGVVSMPIGRLALWSVGLTLAGLATLVAFRWILEAAGARESPVLRDLLPRSGRERGVFALLSLTAGFAEELAYRGYAIPVLAPLAGDAAAALLTSLVFGILHGYQGLLGILRTAIIGGILAWGFLASGSLLPAIIAHALIDLVAGLVLGERLLPADGSTARGGAPHRHSLETREP
jgi:membrane protease YdiL (CAAX protease family)